uniref:Palmitoyltransferase n=1 Tax=Terrapene triunguis TaxID=2587831 RepID=A0A674K6Z9_9SAUR
MCHCGRLAPGPPPLPEALHLHFCSPEPGAPLPPQSPLHALRPSTEWVGGTAGVPPAPEHWAVAYLIVFHVIFVLFVWTYWKSVFTLPLQPDKKWRQRENSRNPSILLWPGTTDEASWLDGNVCQLIKPDRCHHCSVCAMCVLKMDHHCPWVNNCVGFSNYKFFLLFLMYSLLYCMYIAATVFKYVIKYWTDELTNGRSKFHVLFLLFVALMFFLSLMFLFGYHCWLVSRNRSTLEAFSAPVFQNGPDKNGFNLGFVKNLQQVFGEEKKLWLLPIVSRSVVGKLFGPRATFRYGNCVAGHECSQNWELVGGEGFGWGCAGSGVGLGQGVGAQKGVRGAGSGRCTPDTLLTSSSSWKQRHVLSPAPMQRHGQVALHTAPSAGAAPTAPIGRGCWPMGAAGAVCSAPWLPLHLEAEGGRAAASRSCAKWGKPPTPDPTPPLELKSRIKMSGCGLRAVVCPPLL